MHDASVGWDPPAEAAFRVSGVMSDGDFLHRGPRLDDVAYALRWFTPARGDENALDWHHFSTVPDRAHRVRVFLDTYGGLPPFDVAETIAARMEMTMGQEWVAGEARWVREHAHLLTP